MDRAFVGSLPFQLASPAPKMASMGLKVASLKIGRSLFCSISVASSHIFGEAAVPSRARCDAWFILYRNAPLPRVHVVEFTSQKCSD